jgi:hypothetical protein
MTTSEQARADAMADAETFMRVLGICYPVSKDSYGAAYHAQWCAEQALIESSPNGRIQCAYAYAAASARAAFRAVPGLRG